MKNNYITFTALAATLALVLGYVEHLIPLPIPIPGVKLGLSNLAVLFMLYTDRRAAWVVMFLKVLLSGLLFSGMSAFLFSCAGGILSLSAMHVLHTSGKFSVVGVSIAGGIFHNIGQILAAGLILRTGSVFYYLPFLIAAGLVTGIIIGVICKIILARVHIKHFNKEEKQ